MRLKQFYYCLIAILIIACEEQQNQSLSTEMNTDNINVPSQSWGFIDGKEVIAYTISNSNGLQMTVLNYGGIVQKFEVPDATGKLRNIVLGFNSLEGYLQEGNPYIGALIGRYANRIERGTFEINGNKYQLTKNNDGNTLHSGEQGFHNVIWEVEPLSHSSLLLKYLSPDGQEGFPGNLSVEVIYILTDKNEWIIDYNAKTDKTTPVNFTQHTYFNLNGLVDTSNILGHHMQLNVNRYTPVNEKMIPTGEIISVARSPFDFKNGKTIGQDIHLIKGGYDHNLIFEEGRAIEEPVAIVRDSASNISLTMFTTEPAVQFFTGGVLNGTLKNTTHQKGYDQFAGFCLEAQQYPNAPNQSNFPNTFLRPTEQYYQKTIYRIGL